MVERRLWFKQSAARVTKRIVIRGVLEAVVIRGE
jgi:hypothetical protein